MDDLVAFLRGCLDEDERVAKAATAGPWTATPVVYGPWNEGSGPPKNWEIDTPSTTVVEHVYHEGGGIAIEADATHIALHDPARVLREVESKRTIIERHVTDIDSDHWEARLAADDFGEAALRLLAAVYSDRPGYREEWRP